MSEIYPLDEHDSAIRSQDDVKSILASLALIQKNAGVASEYIQKGDTNIGTSDKQSRKSGKAYKI